MMATLTLRLNWLRRVVQKNKKLIIMQHIVPQHARTPSAHYLQWPPQKNTKLKQFNMKTAFLYGELEEVYLEQPESFDDDSGHVYRLK